MLTWDKTQVKNLLIFFRNKNDQNKVLLIFLKKKLGLSGKPSQPVTWTLSQIDSRVRF